MKNGNIECDIKYNIHTDNKINEYINIVSPSRDLLLIINTNSIIMIVINI